MNDHLLDDEPAPSKRKLRRDRKMQDNLGAFDVDFDDEADEAGFGPDEPSMGRAMSDFQKAAAAATTTTAATTTAWPRWETFYSIEPTTVLQRAQELSVRRYRPEWRELWQEIDRMRKAKLDLSAAQTLIARTALSGQETIWERMNHNPGSRPAAIRHNSGIQYDGAAPNDDWNPRDVMAWAVLGSFATRGDVGRPMREVVIRTILTTDYWLDGTAGDGDITPIRYKGVAESSNVLQALRNMGVNGHFVRNTFIPYLQRYVELTPQSIVAAAVQLGPYPPPPPAELPYRSPNAAANTAAILEQLGEPNTAPPPPQPQVSPGVAAAMQLVNSDSPLTIPASPKDRDDDQQMDDAAA